MKKNHLALTVTMISIGMILAVYILMQIIAFFRDNAILGLTSLAALPGSVVLFIAMYVLPPMLICGTLLYRYARPLEKILDRLRAGETLDENTAEQTRVRMLRFSFILYILNMIGFVLGYVILVIIEDSPSGLITPFRLLILVTNITGALIYASAQASLTNIAFGELRDRLELREIGKRKREMSRKKRQIIVGVSLVIYTLTFMEFNGQMADKATNLALSVITAQRQGLIMEEDVRDAYITGIPAILPSVLSRPGYNPEEVILPWETPGHAVRSKQIVFFLHAFFILLVAALVHTTGALEVSDQLKAMRARLRDVLDGEGDLRKRLTLRSMDEYGEQAELINRLLERFHAMASRIFAASQDTHQVAQSIDRVLREAEDQSQRAAQAVDALAHSIETEADSSRELTRAIESFREAAAAVDQAIDEQKRFTEGSAAAMEEMAANIRSVETMTGRAGGVAEELAHQGDEGVSSVHLAGEAIAEIESAAQNVLVVLKSLSKIAGDTNLLAMNAAIEAAHAGTSGAGFAVVANEVRTLATNAAKETKSIKDLMATMNARVQRGVEASSITRSTFSRLSEGITRSASISREIAQAMREQAQGTSDVEKAISRVIEATGAIRTRMDEQEKETGEMTIRLSAALNRLSALAESSRTHAQSVLNLEGSFASVRSEVDKNLAAASALEQVLAGLKL